MNTKIKAKKSKDYSQTISNIVAEIESADKILIGAGSGLSASAGLNYKMISKMLKGFNEEILEVIDIDIPRCRVCGGLLSLTLELGVGFNTPAIIRYPFEDMTYD